MPIYFTSDTHFNHTNIIKYDGRPFVSSQDMNEKLIRNWNSCVQPTETVYHLGDVGFGRPALMREILSRLNGKIFLVRGNHDKAADHRDCSDRFEWIKDYHMGVFNDGVRIVMFHYAMRTWHHSNHGAWHLYGHSHGRLPPLDNSLALDIGVNSWGYRPVSMLQLRQVMEQRGWKSKKVKLKT